MGLRQYIKTLNPKRKFIDIANSYGGLDLIDYINAINGSFEFLSADNINSGFADFYIINSSLINSDTANINIINNNLLKFQTLNFTESNNYYVGLKAGSLSTNTVYTLPLQDGSNKQSLMTNGKGTLYWDSIAGSGDVIGPDNSTNNAIALWDGTSGSLLKNSIVTIDFNGNIDTVGEINTSLLNIKHNAILSFAQNELQNTNIKLIFPENTGKANQVLTTDGTGILNWTSVNSGDSGAPSDATYVIQQANAGLPNAQVLTTLNDGIVFNTKTTGALSTKVRIDLTNLPPLYTTIIPEITGKVPQVYAGTDSGDVEVSNVLGGIVTDLALLNIWKAASSFIAASGIPGVTFPAGQRLEVLTRGGLLRTTKVGDVATPDQPAGAGFLRTAVAGTDYLGGPNNSTTNAIVLWDSTNGLKIKDSKVKIDANANITNAESITCNGKLAGSKLELTAAANFAITLKASNVALNLGWTLPSTQGNVNQVLAITGANGVLGWAQNGNGDVVKIGNTSDNKIVLWNGDNKSEIKTSTASIDANGNLLIQGDITSNNITVTSNVSAKKLIMQNTADLVFEAGNNTTNITLRFPTTAGSDGEILTRSGNGIGNIYDLKWSKIGSGDVIKDGITKDQEIAIWNGNDTNKITSAKAIITGNGNITALGFFVSNNPTNTNSVQAGFQLQSTANTNIIWELPLTAGFDGQSLVRDGAVTIDGAYKLKWSNSDGNVKSVANAPVTKNNVTIWSDDTGKNITTSSVNITNGSLNATQLLVSNLTNKKTGFKANEATINDIIYTLPITSGNNGQVLTLDLSNQLKWADGGGNITLEGDIGFTNHVVVFGSSKYQIKDSGVNVSTIKGYADSAKQSAEASAASAEAAEGSAIAAEGSAIAAAGSAAASAASAEASAGAVIAAGASAIAAGVSAALAGTRAASALNSAQNAKISEENAANSAQNAQNALNNFLNTDLVFTGEIVGSGKPSENIALTINASNQPSNQQFLQALIVDQNVVLKWADGGGSGGGDVNGPNNSTTNAIAIWSDDTGKNLNNSTVLIDNNNIKSQGTITTTGVIVTANTKAALTLQANTNMSQNVSLTLPISDGQAGQVLTTDGAGVLYWSTPSPSSNKIIGPSVSTLNSFVAFGSINGAIVLNSNTIFANNNLTTNKITAKKLILN